MPDPIAVHTQPQHQPHPQLQQCQLPCTKLEEDLRQEGAVVEVEQAVGSPYPQVTVMGAPNSELDISLSSTADVNDDLGFMDRLLPIDMAMFDQLSPTLQTEDFSFSMDNSTEGIQDLFDLCWASWSLKVTISSLVC